MSRLNFAVVLTGIIVLVSCSDDGAVSPAGMPFTPALAKAPPPPSDPTATFEFPLDDDLLSLKSDGLYANATHSLYANGVCGVTAKIFASAGASGDATMQTNNPTASDRKCLSYPRKMTVAYSDGFSETIPVFMNVRQIQNTVLSIPVGDSALRAFSVNPTQKTRCDALRWMKDGQSVQGDSVWVVREASNRWHVRSQPAPNDHAYCGTLATAFHMPVDFVITTP